MVKLSDLIAGMLRTVAGGCERLPTPSEHDSNPQTSRVKRDRFVTHSVFFPSTPHHFAQNPSRSLQDRRGTWLGSSGSAGWSTSLSCGPSSSQGRAIAEQLRQPLCVGRNSTGPTACAPIQPCWPEPAAIHG